VHDIAVAERVPLNLWGVTAERVAGIDDVEVTWGGVVPGDAEAAAQVLAGLARAGATWAVCAPPFTPGDPLPGVRLVAEAAAVYRQGGHEVTR
jgi:hypothetical protein